MISAITDFKVNNCRELSPAWDTSLAETLNYNSLKLAYFTILRRPNLPSNAMQLPAIWQQSAESVSSIVQLPHRALELEGVAACERNRFPSASPCADLGSAQEIIIDHPYTSTGWILTYIIIY